MQFEEAWCAKCGRLTFPERRVTGELQTGQMWACEGLAAKGRVNLAGLIDVSRAEKKEERWASEVAVSVAAAARLVFVLVLAAAVSSSCFIICSIAAVSSASRGNSSELSSSPSSCISACGERKSVVMMGSVPACDMLMVIVSMMMAIQEVFVTTRNLYPDRVAITTRRSPHVLACITILIYKWQVRGHIP